jgi:hypothetical protein
MSKLVAAIRNRFVPVAYSEISRHAASAEAVGSHSRTLAAAVESAASLHWRFAKAAAPKPLVSFRERLPVAELEGLRPQARELHPSVPSTGFVPNAAMVGLASKAPSICSLVRRINRYQ